MHLSKLILPVKDTITGETTNLEFDIGGSSAPEERGFGYGICTTAYITTAKTVEMASFVLTKNGIVSVTFNNGLPSNSTLNVNNTGAKPLYHRGSPILNNVVYSGDTATFIYDGTNFNLIAIDRTPTVTKNSASF